MAKYSIKEIASVISKNAVISKDLYIRYLLTDSRSLSYPQESLFFAFKTLHNDGHKYLLSLYERGLRNFVVQYLPSDFVDKDDINIILVQDSLEALQSLAAYHRQHIAAPILAITGSNGKTVVKEWLYQLLGSELKILRSPRSYNSQIGVPLSVWQLNDEMALGIIEAGISTTHEMQSLETIISPSMGLLTNIGEAHQEGFLSKGEKIINKMNLFIGCETFFYNADDYAIAHYVSHNFIDKKIKKYSRKDKKADLYISKVDISSEITYISYLFKGNENSISIPFTDAASIENAIQCLLLVLYLHPNITDIQNKFLSLEPVEMRLEVKKGIAHCTIINDAYNSDINSLEIALDFMLRRSFDKKAQTILILSDILQSGISPHEYYRALASIVKAKKVDRLIGIGTFMSRYQSEFDFKENDTHTIHTDFYIDTEQFLRAGAWRSFANSLILLKGSRQFAFEKIASLLEEKVHQTVLEVDLDAIVHNFKYFRSLLKSPTKIIAMVKAFGYGMGSYELAKTLQDQGCDYLAVAVADEGASLRQEGITMPIIVMNPEQGAFNTLLDYRLEPEIYSFKLLDTFRLEVQARALEDYPIHLKLDTGMHRLGFETKDLPLLVNKLKEQGELKLSSVFTHLAGTDVAEEDKYTEMQVNSFIDDVDFIEQSLGVSFMRHVLNSAGIERFAKYQFDMVRLGIGLYGVSALAENNLREVAFLKASILSIKSVKKGEAVGYNRREIMQHDALIACFSIGYADGLDRRLGNGRGGAIVNGTLCPLVGNICMDLCMVDITGVVAKEGDSAIFFGKGISIHAMAKQLETIPYEILTSVSSRVKRIYFKE
ncbi:bifunctional UDP-N-acetylmuramoyl-tripeptide:D-alanyl-D-alanine ligase/alanine racemase [Bacteroidales bacterium]|nr:bifunctional UDP-N-acetylmuramoyl-tripeptide:D-alanyl-D-alanine ligase/alanine racemase [Bacteroidales bacterium]